jgi:hypothetical protein
MVMDWFSTLFKQWELLVRKKFERRFMNKGEKEDGGQFEKDHRI